MILIYFMLGAALSVPEVTLVVRYDWLYNKMKHNPVFEIIFSLGLGFACGLAMGVGPGLTFAVGNFFGTFITKAIYSLRLIEGCRAIKKSAINTCAAVQKTWSEIQSLVHVVWAVVTFIPRMLMKMLHGLNDAATWWQSRKPLFHR